MRSAPPLIVWMSFRLAIPWWVALPQGPPPLRQPVLIMRYSRLAGRGIFIERRTVSYLYVSAEGTSAAVERLHHEMFSMRIRQALQSRLTESITFRYRCNAVCEVFGFKGEKSVPRSWFLALRARRLLEAR